MPYKIYRKITVQEIKTETVTPLRRPSDIMQDTFGGEPYEVTKAYFSNHQSATIHGMEHIISPKQLLSVAVNEDRQVIAAVNHITGKKDNIDSSFLKNVKEYVFALIYTVPFVAFGSWLMWRSIPFFKAGNEAGFIPLTFGLGAFALGVFIFAKVVEANIETKKAMKELLKEKS